MLPTVKHKGEPTVTQLANCRIRNNEKIRESFVCDANSRYKPRMAWYNPNDGMFPSNWFSEGLMADLAYYKPFTGVRSAAQAW